MNIASTDSQLTIVLNGESVTVAPKPLDALLEALGYDLAYAAVAVNDTVVFRRDLSRTVVRDGDCVEVLAPMAGG
jgi:thiamine biosynthesis protein ThiS